MDIYCYPLDKWNGPVTETRTKASYGARWSTVIRELEAEAEALGADELLILLDVRRDQLRLDGWPKAGTTPPPQIAVAFTSKHGPLRFECDRWNRWEDNVRAVGLTLQRLRLIDEGGVARSGEQYRGWQAIGPGTGFTTTALAAQFIAQAAGAPKRAAEVLNSPELRQQIYREAAQRLHPDKGGNADDFRRLTEARDMLARI